MRLSELGEFGLIDLVRSIADRYQRRGHTLWPRLLVGIGDDAAAWESDNDAQLATTDTLVQGVHFDLDVINWDELGWKALAVNLSDIAAMGGVPKYALLSLALPGELEVKDISEFLEGMMHVAMKFGVAIIGGNVATAPIVVITMTVIGSCTGKRMLKRSTASLGEQVAVTGSLGLSAAGLQMLKGKTISDTKTSTILRQAHFKPMPRVEEGQILLEQGVNTAIDISDGLIADLHHICQASKVSANLKVDQVPVHPSVIANFSNYRELALTGGEDYELLFTGDQATVARAKQALNCPVTVIGEITEEKLPERVTLVDSKGTIVHYEKGGWDHFKSVTRNASACGASQQVSSAGSSQSFAELA